MKKIINIAIILTFSMLCFQSCECPCENPEVSSYQCSPREATINQFNSDLAPVDPNNDIEIQNGEINSINYYPDTAYSIHTFQFPNNLKSSGSLPNDRRYTAQRGVSEIPFVKIKMSEYGVTQPFFFAVLTSIPSNEEIRGDILVEYAETEIDLPNSPFTDLRFAGHLAKVASRTFNSEASRDFCDYLEDNNLTDKQSILNYRNDLSEYGRNVPNSTENSLTFNQNNMVIVNSANQIIAEFNNGNWEIVNYTVNAEQYYILNENARIQLENDLENINNTKVYQDLMEQNDAESVTVRAFIGDVFFYRSIKGRDFIFAILNIDERDFGVAYKKRVSIMFNEL